MRYPDAMRAVMTMMTILMILLVACGDDSAMDVGMSDTGVDAPSVDTGVDVGADAFIDAPGADSLTDAPGSDADTADELIGWAGESGMGLETTRGAVTSRRRS